MKDFKEQNKCDFYKDYIESLRKLSGDVWRHTKSIEEALDKGEPLKVAKHLLNKSSSDILWQYHKEHKIKHKNCCFQDSEEKKAIERVSSNHNDRLKLVLNYEAKTTIGSKLGFNHHQEFSDLSSSFSSNFTDLSTDESKELGSNSTKELTCNSLESYFHA